MNVICICGRLTADPELRTTTTGKQVVSFTVAVDKRFKPQDGSASADFFRCQAWGKTAEFVANYLAKGRLVSVDGRIESRKFTDKEGNQRETWEVTAENVQGLDRPKDEGAVRPSAPATDDYDVWADD